MLLTGIGFVGVGLVLIAYALMTAGKLRANAPLYQWLNVSGTAGILLSLLGQWNLPAFLTNVAWISIGIASLIRIYRRRRQA